MGYMRHHAIIVSSWKDDHIQAAHRIAIDLEMAVSDIISSPMNHELSFFIAPDGSKEGWDDSKLGDTIRLAFKGWMKNSAFYFKWVEVQYGDDEHETKIIDFGPQ